MTPAQDATALADRLSASIGPYHINEFERRQIVAALRATSQTPDAVGLMQDCRDLTFGTIVENIAASDRNPIKRGIFIRKTSAKIAEYATKEGCHSTPLDNLRATLSTPSASAGPQAEAVKESLHYLWAIKVRLQLLYEQSTQDSRLLEHLSDEVDWIDAEIGRLRAHPQPQQADGRGAVIEALKHFGRHDDDCAVKKPPFKCSCGFHAALQQSPATDGPAK